MSSINTRPAFRGGCHCGQIHVAFSSALQPASITPRACDCSFCQKHGATYVSDPAGRLSITVKSADALRRYRQGSNAAEFLLCGECGVLVGVVFEHRDRIYGAVNARALDEPTGFGAAAVASPQLLAAEGKIARWLQVWIANVELLIPGN